MSEAVVVGAHAAQKKRRRATGMLVAIVREGRCDAGFDVTVRQCE
jgi:hypothetical protein